MTEHETVVLAQKESMGGEDVPKLEGEEDEDAKTRLTKVQKIMTTGRKKKKIRKNALK